MGLISSLAPFDKSTYGNDKFTVRVLVECEKDSIHKYEYDDEIGAMVIVRDLDPQYPYPYAYGAIPQTLADDGDPLDAIVVSDETIRSGTVVNCIPIAIIRTVDNGEGDDKVVCIPFYTTTGDVSIDSILEYLSQYKYPFQDGTVINSVDGPKEAFDAIITAHKAYLEASK